MPALFVILYGSSLPGYPLFNVLVDSTEALMKGADVATSLLLSQYSAAQYIHFSTTSSPRCSRCHLVIMLSCPVLISLKSVTLLNRLRPT
jgi:hypothetical protein